MTRQHLRRPASALGNPLDQLQPTMSDLDRYLTEEAVEKAARTEWEYEWPERSWDDEPDDLRDFYISVARASLTAVLPDIIQQAKAEVLREAEPALQTMLEYGSAIRGNWSDFDGRTMQIIIEDWVQEIRTPDPSHTVEWHRRDLELCMAGGGHWCGRWGYCDDECGCEPCAA